MNLHLTHYFGQETPYHTINGIIHKNTLKDIKPTFLNLCKKILTNGKHSHWKVIMTLVRLLTHKTLTKLIQFYLSSEITGQLGSMKKLSKNLKQMVFTLKSLQQLMERSMIKSMLLQLILRHVIMQTTI